MTTSWEAWKLADLEEQRARGNDPWLEFFRTSTLRTGLYVLPAGGTDPQGPHQQDEVYSILQGKAVLTVDGAEQPVGPGTVVYVKAGVEHRFHSISEELKVLVFFAG
jgi:mannose-6-phosphate isomerase-like protein (cupin superfamily)